MSSKVAVMLAETFLPSSWISSSLSFVRLTVSDIPDTISASCWMPSLALERYSSAHFLANSKFVACVVNDGAVATDEAAAVEAIQLHPLLVCLANHGRGWRCRDLLSPAHPQLLQTHHLVVGVLRLHFLVRLRTIGAYKLRALTAEGLGFAFHAHLAACSHPAARFLHLTVDVLDAVDEVGGRQDGGVLVRRQLGQLAALRAGERVPSIGQGPDTLVAVVVAARQNLWVEVVLEADSTSYLLAQFLYSLLDQIGIFRHRNSDTQQILAAV